MKLILEITSHTGDGGVIHETVEAFPVTLGRGYHNSIILTDPHVGADHLRIEYEGSEDGQGVWTVRELGSVNGLVFGGRSHKATAVRVSSGEHLRVGKTDIRFFSPEHPVPSAMRLQKVHPFFQWLARSQNVWASALLALAVTLSWSYLEVWTDDTGMTLAAYGAGMFFIVLVWAALWSAAGRVIRHKSNFKSHVALASLCIIAFVVLWYVQSYADFLSSENWVAFIVSYTLNFALLAALLYGCLTLATDMPKERRAAAAGYLSAGVLAGVFILTMVGAQSFNEEPSYSFVLEPFLSGLAPASDIEAYMQESAKVFDAEEFVKPESGS